MGRKRRTRTAGSGAPVAEGRPETRGGPPWILIGGGLAALALVGFLALNGNDNAVVDPESEIALNEAADETPEPPPAPPPEERDAAAAGRRRDAAVASAGGPDSA